MSEATVPYDAILLLSFGGPEGPDDVIPFLENVTRGRGIPRERLEQVGGHYYLFGGVSPINGQCRELLAALEPALAEAGIDLPVYWGNRNWHPMLADTVARMKADGVRRALAVATSAFSSYSACRQYLDDIAKARAAVGEGAPEIDKLAPYWNHPGFLETMIASTEAALARAREASAVEDAGRRILFTAHSIPTAMAETCDYETELREASALIAAAAAPGLAFELVFQSRSGPPTQPWLEPDVCDRLRELSADGVASVVLVPVGFVSDHMEVLYDLDTEAKTVAEELGLSLVRAATVGTAPRFVAGLVELLGDRIAGRPSRSIGSRGARPFPCEPGCCAYTPRRPAPSPEARS
jgi:ferrochelatase